MKKCDVDLTPIMLVLPYAEYLAKANMRNRPTGCIEDYFELPFEYKGMSEEEWEELFDLLYS